MVREVEDALGALNTAGVRYLVVGGLAVVLHGHLRTTADMDLVVQLEPANALRALRALGDLGYRPRAPVALEAFADPATRLSWVRDKGLTVFSMWNPSSPSLELDLFVEEPFVFDDVYRRASRVPLERVHAPVIALNDLIEMKRAAGRARDLEDVAALEAIRDEGPNPPEDRS